MGNGGKGESGSTGQRGGEPSARPDAREQQLLLEELRDHQIELEAQNEELRRAHAALSARNQEHIELYDNAPIGYLTLDELATVRKANVKAAETFATSVRALVGYPLVGFVVPEDRSVFLEAHEKGLHEGCVRWGCEVRIRPVNGAPRWVQMDNHAGADAS